MKAKRMDKGVHVIIKNDLSETHKAHSSCDEMGNMAGEMHMIDEVIKTDHGLAAHICGFTWHPGDLKEVCPKKKAQEFHFDAEGLHP